MERTALAEAAEAAAATTISAPAVVLLDLQDQKAAPDSTAYPATTV